MSGTKQTLSTDVEKGTDKMNPIAKATLLGESSMGKSAVDKTKVLYFATFRPTINTLDLSI